MNARLSATRYLNPGDVVRRIAPGMHTSFDSWRTVISITPTKEPGFSYVRTAGRQKVAVRDIDVWEVAIPTLDEELFEATG